MTILVFNIHPAPYRDLTLKNLSLEQDLNPIFCFYNSFDNGHKEWKYKYKGFNAVFLGRSFVYKIINLFFILFTRKVQLYLIPGYSNIYSIIILTYCLLFKKKYILCLDSVYNKPNILLIEKIKDFIMLSAKGYWVPGKASRKYLESQYKIKSDFICEGYYCLSKEYFDEIIPLKNQNDKNHKVVYLSIGNFITSRNYINLVKAFDLAQKESLTFNNSCELILIGDGEEYEKIQNISKSNSNIRLMGKIEISQLPFFYKKATWFIHPGTEPFSTAMELAASFNVNIISTNHVGFLNDYIFYGGDPVIFNDLSVEGLKKKLLFSFLEHKNISSNYLEIRNSEWAKNELNSLIKMKM